MGEKGEGSGGEGDRKWGKGGGNWEWGTPLSTPSVLAWSMIVIVYWAVENNSAQADL